MADWEKEIANSTEPAIVAEPVASEAVSEVSETMSEPSENLDVAPVPAQEATTDVVSEPVAEATSEPADEAAPLQSHCQADRAAQARRRVGASRTRCHEARAEVPPAREADGDSDKHADRHNNEEERPPLLTRERSGLLRPADR